MTTKAASSLRLIETLDEAPEGAGLFLVMDGTGDSKYTWNRHDTSEVELAKETFDRYRAKGYLAFSCTKEGAKGEQVREFNAQAEAYIFVPPMKAG